MNRVQGTLDQKSVSIKLDTHKMFATNHTLVATPSIPQTLYYMIILYPVQIVVHYKPDSTILLKVSTQYHQSSLAVHAVVSFRNCTSLSQYLVLTLSVKNPNPVSQFHSVCVFIAPTSSSPYPLGHFLQFFSCPHPSSL